LQPTTDTLLSVDVCGPFARADPPNIDGFARRVPARSAGPAPPTAGAPTHVASAVAARDSDRWLCLSALARSDLDAARGGTSRRTSGARGWPDWELVTPGRFNRRMHATPMASAWCAAAFLEAHTLCVSPTRDRVEPSPDHGRLRHREVVAHPTDSGGDCCARRHRHRSAIPRANTPPSSTRPTGATSFSSRSTLCRP
jgi:hypothetical protein